MPTLGNPTARGHSIAVIYPKKKDGLTVSLSKSPGGQQQKKYLHFLQSNLTFKNIQTE